MIRRRGSDRGSVVAEFAVALPAVVLVLAFAVGAAGTAIRQIRLQDAAADAARLVARGESEERAIALVGDAVPGARATVEPRDDLVCVSATAGAVLVPLQLRASGCALAGGL